MKNGGIHIRRMCIFLALILASGMLAAGCSATPTPAAATAASTAEPTQESTTAPTDTPEPTATPLAGTITISMPFAEAKPVWDDLAKDYMDRNPGVTVVIDNKDTASYAEWLGNQLAGGDVTADIVVNNTAIVYFSQGKFVDYSLYLNKANPYMDGAVWKDGLAPEAYSTQSVNGIFTIDTDYTQVLWFYNKSVFEKAGVEAPKDWDELVAACQKIKEAGYTPIAMAGDAGSITMHLGWLQWVYVDQYFRDMEPLAVVQEGDFNYDAQKIGAWQFDPADPLNDSATKVDFNTVRVLKMLLDGQVGPDTDKYREMFGNFAKIIPGYVEDGFFGTDFLTAQQLFLQGKAGIFMNTVDFAASFDNLVKNASSEPFELGYFTSPPMVGDNVGINYTRTIGGQVGFIGVINKDKAQNDLNMDFMMYYVSKTGQDLRYSSMFENGLAPSGSSLVKGAVMPEKWQKIFGDLKYNGEHPAFNPYFIFSWGLDAEGTRSFQDYSQQFFLGKLTLDDFSKKLQKSLVEAVPRFLTSMGMRADATDDPSKNPLPQ